MNQLNHLGIIMDGNRRWAKKRGLPIIFGHRKGANKLFDVCDWCIEYNIKILTVYVFSTQNWNRSSSEIKNLFRLIEVIFHKEIDNFKKKNIRVNVVGNYKEIEENCVRSLKKLMEETKTGKKLTLNLAINYGGKEDIIQAIKTIIDENKSSKTINMDNFSQYLYLSNTSPIDLVIRTGGQHRLSNFFIWETCNSEIYVTDTLWPDFSLVDFISAVDFYKNVQINNGK